MAAEESLEDGELSAIQGQEEPPVPAAREEELHPEQDSRQPEDEPGEKVEEEEQQQLETLRETEPQPEGEEQQQQEEAAKEPEAGEEAPAEEQQQPRDARTPGGEEVEGAETVEQAQEEEARVSEPEPTVQEKDDDDEQEEEEQQQQQRSRQSSLAEEQEEKDDEEDQIRGTAERSELVLRYLAMCGEREMLLQHSLLLQHKLCTSFRRRRGSEVRRSPKSRSSVPASPLPASAAPALEMEQRYQRTLEALTELRVQFMQDSAQYKQQADELESRCQEILEKVDVDWRVFQERKKQVALAVLSRRGGKQAAVEELEQMQAREQRREETVVQVRLENIKLKDQVHELELELRASEELAEGLHLIDFEQLKIENQTYNEKIEERNEELQKLRRKITSTVHVLAHLKEKLQFVQAENLVKKDRLTEVEAAVALRRDILTKTKQARDSLRISNVKLRQKCGLLGNEALLRDFEDKVDASEELSRRLETLKRRHAELTLNCSAIKKKIKEAKLAKAALQK
ncbi:cilia- and flagella-associated protein 184 [Microcaecilia unicolor]|uniref:Coiled-coil domain-containing protein 96 n=1 Tax=Microcaecilia unicolor TaxID=1415580 RepID=A0A6P7WV31_9AMPH|nr:coiled-coil domain-containing protein 96 [Microcaecilia unicolor]